MSRKNYAPLALCTLSVTAVGLYAAQPAAALVSSAAITGLTGASYATQNGNFSVGFKFTVGTMPVIVTSLGYVNDGFGSPHGVGIYDASNTLIGYTVVTASTTKASASSPTFTYGALTTPVTLTSGSTYSIVAGNYTGGLYLTGATVTTDSRLTYVGSVYSATNNSNAFQPPAYAGGAGGDFGPNFLIAPAAVSAAPEPSEFGMLALMGLGLGGLMLRGCRRKARP